jgi:multiple sugar transport system ATP-binding protein
MIYATPDQLEALSMGRRIAVLRAGRIVQVAAPRELYTDPIDSFVAGLVGDPPINLLTGILRERGGRQKIELPFAEIDAAPWTKSLDGFPAGTELTVGVRPQDIMVRPAAGSELIGPQFSGRVFLTEPLGDVTVLNVVAGSNNRLKMILPQERAFQIRADDSLDCALRLDHICLFARETGTAIRRNGAKATN